MLGLGAAGRWLVKPGDFGKKKDKNNPGRGLCCAGSASESRHRNFPRTCAPIHESISTAVFQYEAREADPLVRTS
jgi:hypothetical protein